MYIKDIYPKRECGISLNKHDDIDNIIDNYIEEPLKNAVRIFCDKNIETVMSSANLKNLISEEEKPIEKEDLNYLEHIATYEDAGVGYAWIMINFDSLSNDNKQMLFLIEEKIGPSGSKVGEKTIWFCESNIKKFLSYRGNFKTNDEIDEDNLIYLNKFEERKIVLGYNPYEYPKRVVILRMRIHPNTTVNDVDNFFTMFADNFKDQKEEILKIR